MRGKHARDFWLRCLNFSLPIPVTSSVGLTTTLMRRNNIETFSLGNERSEKEVMAPWNKTETPVVSIICHTYQQESFVSAALEGFISQETSFPFEIIVHDDASTDGTREIIKQYAKKYPNLINAIFQDTNQFAQNRKPHTFTFPFASGEFVALCEGDDYWISPDKLERQVLNIRPNPEAAGCFHAANDLDEATGIERASRWAPPSKAKSYYLDDLLSKGNFFPTASLVFRKELIGDPAELLADVPHGDFAILAKLLMAGPMLYIDEAMSVYRRHAGGIHSSVWGPISTFRALKTRVNTANRLGLQKMESYKVGLGKHYEQLEDRLIRDQETIDRLEAELQRLQQTYDRARQSKFFRLGMAIDNTFRTVTSRLSR